MKSVLGYVGFISTFSSRVWFVGFVLGVEGSEYFVILEG